MVLGHPERVVAALVHALGIGHDLVHDAGQLLLRIAALVDRRALIAELLHVDGAVIGAVEFRDHRWGPLRSAAETLSVEGGFVQRKSDRAAMTRAANRARLGGPGRPALPSECT